MLCSHGWFDQRRKKKESSSNTQMNQFQQQMNHLWVLGVLADFSACGSGHGDMCKSRPDLTETPHCEAWTWLCQHLMDRFPLRSLLRPRSPRRCCFKLRPACWLRPCPVVLFQRVLYCFRAIVGGLRSALCSLLGGIVPLRCACLCYWPVCQDSHSFTLRDPLVPTVAGPPTSGPLLPNQAGECVRLCEGGE